MGRCGGHGVVGWMYWWLGYAVRMEQGGKGEREGERKSVGKVEGKRKKEKAKRKRKWGERKGKWEKGKRKKGKGGREKVKGK